MAYTPDKPLSLNSIRKELVEATEQKNVLIAQIANASYTPSETIPNAKYSIEKRMLSAAQKEVELINSYIASTKALIVTITEETVDDSTVTTADKTAREICAAVFDGKPILLFMNDSTYVSCDVTFDSFDEDSATVSISLGWFDFEGTRSVITVTDTAPADGDDT